MIRNAQLADADVVSEIYNYYVLNTVVTFEEEEVLATDMRERMSDVIDADLPWLVCEEGGQVRGFAYASKWKGRCAYRYSVEVTVYVSPTSVSGGLGSKLYDALFKRLKQSSVHVVMGGIALPNVASIALHEKFGMRKVAHFEEVGFKFGKWVDVAYWQATLT